jgi:hypothetical protein
MRREPEERTFFLCFFGFLNTGSARRVPVGRYSRYLPYECVVFLLYKCSPVAKPTSENLTLFS